MGYFGEIAVNSIYILESIPDGEFKSGTAIFEDIRYLSFKYDYLSIHYNNIDNFSELEKVLNEIYLKSKGGEFPIIHFEAYHGSANHFITKDGKYFEWERFLRLIQPINIELNLKLLVSIGACFSAYFLSHMYRLIKEPAPCLASIGSGSEITSGEIARQYTLFYRTLIEKESIIEAHKKLKTEYKDNSARLLFIHAPKMFKDGFKQAYKNRYSGDNLDKNIERLKDKIKKSDAIIHDHFRNKTDKELRELLLIGSIIQKDLSPELYANKFFMCDLYPENYIKFDVANIIKEMKKFDV